MREMIIRPHGTADQQIPYATGRFGRDDAFIVNQIGATSPFGGLLCSFGSDYAVELLPDGSGCSWYFGKPITPAARLGKAWYIRDKETGEVWSAFFSPVGAKSDEYEIRYEPGQATAYCLRNKIASTLTIATVPHHSYELWLVKIENRAARHRTLEFTTYAEIFGVTTLEALFRQKEKALLMRRPLDAEPELHTAVNPGSGAERTPAASVFFHSSTLTPSRFGIERTDFIGDGRTLANPIYVEKESASDEVGTIANPAAALTVEVELPIEGEAQFGFCFGVAPSPESALSTIHAYYRRDAIAKAVEDSRKLWRDLSSVVHVDTSDGALNALINTWLPYETYAGWTKERSGSGNLDPSRVADVLRCRYPLGRSSFDASRKSLLNFAAGLSLLGSYSSDGASLVNLPPAEMLWLVICTARYIAESGDAAVLDESIALRDGPALPLREHCERIIRLYSSSAAGSEDGDPRLLAQTIRLWSLVRGELGDLAGALEVLDRRSIEREEHAEQRSLPRRVRYLQSLSPTLSDKAVINDLCAYLQAGEAESGDVDAACSVYAALVERTLGIVATCEGLTLRPKLPDSWFECEVTRVFRGDTYRISVSRKGGGAAKSASIVVDGEPVLGEMLPFFGDGNEHRVEVTVG